MPDGVVQWVDPGSGRASVVRAARVFPSRVADMDPAARHAGAHVHFDITREGTLERAVGVTLRNGGRTTPHHRGFGSGVGSHDSGARGSTPFARPHTDLGISLTSHPLEVGAAWSRCVLVGDLDSALLLYAPDAVVHTANGDVVGQTRVRQLLESAGLGDRSGAPEVRGDDGHVVVRWGAPGPEAGAFEVRGRIERGLIVEQWIGPAVPERRRVEVATPGGPVEVAVTAGGAVDEADVAYGLERLRPILGTVGAPVLFARLKLSYAPDPARERPAIAQMTIDVDGAVVRAHVAAHQIREAADLVARRMEDLLEHRARRREELHRRGPGGGPGEWRHGDTATERPDYFDRPVEDRQVVRHKIFAVAEMTPDEAVFDMELADHDFYLFRDLASGEDSLVEAGGDGRYLLTRLHPTAVDGGPSAYQVVPSGLEPPVLSVTEAIDRLDAGGEDRVFFANAMSGRGNVVYRRYDGHYGLISAE